MISAETASATGFGGVAISPSPRGPALTDPPDWRLGRYDHIVVHCSATQADPALGARDIDRWHRRRGFSGCGYHVVIPLDGTWQSADAGYPVRPLGRVGAHVGGCGWGWNGRSLGVCLIGGLDGDGRPVNSFTPAQMETLDLGVRRLLAAHPQPETVTVLGHRDLIARTGAAPKACPCFDVIPWFAARDPRR